MNPRDHERPDLGGLSPWAPELARTFVSLASDIALILDGDGVVLRVVQKTAEAVHPSAADWVGRPWIDTVTGDTRAKIEKLLQEVVSTGSARRREVGHPMDAGDVVPIAYTAVRLGRDGPVLAVGRDLRAVAAIQQRFIETQQDLERDYWRARQAETRYRLLFEVATDGVMVLDAESLEIIEANQAAQQLFSGAGSPLAGKHITAGFDHYSRGAVAEFMHRARGSGDNAEIRARLLGTTRSSSISVTPFRSDHAQRLLVRVRGPDTRLEPGDVSADLARLVDDIREGVVITDTSGRVLMANPAFLRRVGCETESAAKGRPLTDWMRSQKSPFAHVIASVRRDGFVRGAGFEIQDWASQRQAVDVSASLLTEDDEERIGFTIRLAAPGNAMLASAPTPEPAADHLTFDLGVVAARLGELPMTALVSEAVAIVERHLITLALQRTDGDAAAAALLLGISREKVLALAGNDGAA